MSTDIDAELEREQRLDIARKLYQALIAQNPNRSIALCDGEGLLVARHRPWRAEAPSVAESEV
jgi:hypothetical protein